MYLLYLDDSGSSLNPHETHFVLGGVACFERQVHWVNTRLDQLAEEVAPEGVDPGSFEFHASTLRRGGEAPWKGVRKPERIEISRRVLEVLAQANQGVIAFACAVHKASFPGRDPVELAFEELCNRFDLLLKRIYHLENDPQRGLLVIDNTTRETSLRELAVNFRKNGTRWRDIHNLTEVPFFMDSRASRLMQLADHVAYATFRRYQYGDTSLLDIFTHRFDAEGAKIHGLVHKQTALTTCRCVSCLGRHL